MAASSRQDDDLAAVAGRALLVCGHPKSGTSLLLSLLDGHPEILALPEETKYFRAIHGQADLRAAEGLLARTRVGRLGRQRDDAPVAGRNLAGVDAAIFEAELARRLSGEREARELLPAVVLAYAAACGESPRSYWAEKTPLHEHHLGVAIDLWPDLRAIYVIRDPRDVHVSFRAKRRTRGRGLSPLQSVRRMRSSLRVWDAFATRYPDRALLVRYEDLVVAPERTTRGVAAFLGVEWTPGMVAPTVAGRRWEGNSMFDEAHRRVSDSPIGRHWSRLSRWQRWILERGLASEFRRFGWPRAGKSRVRPTPIG